MSSAAWLLTLALAFQPACCAGQQTWEAMLLHGVNATLGAGASKQLEYELHLSSDPGQDKATIAIILFFQLGFLGVDRCCMGQCMLGIVKGLTLGGVFIWNIIDFFTLLINCISASTDIHTMGFNATWDPQTILTAKWLSIFTLLYVIVWPCVQTCCCLCSLVAAAREKTADAANVPGEDAGETPYIKIVA